MSFEGTESACARYYCKYFQNMGIDSQKWVYILKNRYRFSKMELRKCTHVLRIWSRVAAGAGTFRLCFWRDWGVLIIMHGRRRTTIRGGGYSFGACVSHLTIEHAFLSRRSTVPTPNRHFEHLGAHHVLSIYCKETFCLSYPLHVSPSVATIYRIA